jgi:hypothetical protein
LFDELDGIVMQNLKVVGSVGDLPGLIAHELDILFDVNDVFDVFLGGVGVIEPQVAFPFADLRLHEIESHRFAVADMQIAIGFRREPREDDVSELIDAILEQFFGVD